MTSFYLHLQRRAVQKAPDHAVPAGRAHTGRAGVLLGGRCAIAHLDARRVRSVLDRDPRPRR